MRNNSRLIIKRESTWRIFDFCSVKSRGEATSEIPLLVLMSEIKIALTLKKANFLFLECFKIKFI